MIEKPQPQRPVQVFMNTQAFIDFPPLRSGGGSQRDFFAEDDAGFIRHKEAMKEQVAGVSDAVRRRGEKVSFVHVFMREDALAKSHRPVDRLFTSQNGFGLVAGGRAGELVFQCTPQGLDRLIDTIDRAEDHPRVGIAATIASGLPAKKRFGPLRRKTQSVLTSLSFFSRTILLLVLTILPPRFSNYACLSTGLTAG
jgi:hypothetical protein